MGIGLIGEIGLMALDYLSVDPMGPMPFAVGAANFGKCVGLRAVTSRR
jgi:hypothetical protein